MLTFDEAIQALLREGCLTSTRLARVTGVSRQAALGQLKRLLASGRLEVEGAGRATRYVEENRDETSRRRTSEERCEAFWAQLTDECRRVKHVPVLKVVGRVGRTSRGADKCLDRLSWNDFLLLDFAGVDAITQAFAARLAARLSHSGFGLRAMEINTEARVQHALSSAYQYAEMRGRLGPG